MQPKPKTEIQQQIADERRELKAAVESLQDEIDLTARRITTFVSVATGSLIVTRLVLRLTRRR
jgi:hypothetical protein